MEKTVQACINECFVGKNFGAFAAEDCGLTPAELRELVEESNGYLIARDYSGEHCDPGHPEAWIYVTERWGQDHGKRWSERAQQWVDAEPSPVEFGVHALSAHEAEVLRTVRHLQDSNGVAYVDEMDTDLTEAELASVLYFLTRLALVERPTYHLRSGAYQLTRKGRTWCGLLSPL